MQLSHTGWSAFTPQLRYRDGEREIGREREREGGRGRMVKEMVAEII